VGAKGITAAQVAYWENLLQRLTDTPEWAADIALRGGTAQFNNAATMRKRIDEEYPEVKALLTELELAKK